MNKVLISLGLLFSATSFAWNEEQLAHRYEAEVKTVLSASQQQQIAAFSEILKPKSQEPLATHLQKVSQVLVFLSFSMPEKSLQGWLKQSARYAATPVIRGLINNSFQDTMTVIQRLSKQTGSGLQLDPILFQTFAIRQVPAVVHVKTLPSCPAMMNCPPVAFDVIYGDVALDYALKKLNGGDA